MSQGFWSAVPPTPPAQRRAEAEAIYQLLKVLNEDLKRERALTLAGRVTGVTMERLVTMAETGPEGGRQAESLRPGAAPAEALAPPCSLDPWSFLRSPHLRSDG